MSRKLTRKEKIIVFLASSFTIWVQRLLGLTIKKIYVGREEAIRISQDGAIYAFWHNNAFFASYLFPNQDLHALVSSSKDGELITRVIEAFGNKTVRGSSSRGGVSALKTIIELLQAKKAVAFTPDGPRGPIYTVHDGLVMAALSSGRPIIPVHYQATREWVFQKSWDKHRIPKPFTHLVLYFGNPIYLTSVEFPTPEFYKSLTELVKEKIMQNMYACQAECEKISHTR